MSRRLELGEHVVADPEICHGKPTFNGTRIMVWQVFALLLLPEFDSRRELQYERGRNAD